MTMTSGIFLKKGALSIKQHRNNSEICKACGTEKHGKPEGMKQHIVDCKKADHADQLHTLHDTGSSAVLWWTLTLHMNTLINSQMQLSVLHA